MTRSSRVAASILGLVIAGGFYLLLIDTTSPPELYAGAGVVLLAVIAFAAAREQGSARATLDPRWLRKAWRIILHVPIQCGLVSREALVQLVQVAPGRKRRGASRGSFRAIPFEAGSHGPRDVGRCALAEALGSVTPNTIVIGVDTERKLLLVHQLHRQGGREQLDPLELG